MLKTLLATQTLPLSWAIGGTLKAISYLSFDTQQNHLRLRSHLDSLRVQSNDLIYRKMGIPALFSQEWATTKHHPKPEMTTQQKIEFEALKSIAKLLNTHQIAWWVDRGTALGAYRHAGIIPWDHDIDISVLQQDFDNTFRILKQLPAEHYCIQDWSSYEKPGTYLRLYIKQTKTYIDIYTYQLDPVAHTLQYIFSLANSKIMPQKWKKREYAVTQPLSIETIFPLKLVDFDGFPVHVPNQLEVFLHSKYGENLGPARVWNPKTKKYDKINSHPYWKQSHI